MREGQFWLTDEQFAKIERHLPRDTRARIELTTGGGSAASYKF